MRISLLGVPIDALTRVQARKAAERLYAEPRGHLITTPNPEMIVLAQERPTFRRILNEADLALPDGVGLLMVGHAKGLELPERISGTDFVDDLCALALTHDAPVYLLGGGKPDVAQRAAAELAKRHPGLRVAGAENGGVIKQLPDGRWDQDPQLLARIWKAAPHVLFVALGHGKQEAWINDHLQQMPSVRLAIGIGGAFDFIAGDVSRAPESWRKARLEWLWRLIHQPWRVGRIWNAVIKFPWLAFTQKSK